MDERLQEALAQIDAAMAGEDVEVVGELKTKLEGYSTPKEFGQEDFEKYASESDSGKEYLTVLGAKAREDGVSEYIAGDTYKQTVKAEVEKALINADLSKKKKENKLTAADKLAMENNEVLKALQEENKETKRQLKQRDVRTEALDYMSENTIDKALLEFAMPGNNYEDASAVINNLNKLNAAVKKVSQKQMDNEFTKAGRTPGKSKGSVPMKVMEKELEALYAKAKTTGDPLDRVAYKQQKNKIKQAQLTQK